jgi:hypothetical protein
MGNGRAWAEEEFGGAELGDTRRTRRLVALAAEVAMRPAGTVTGACKSSASREGAFRWLENEAVRVEPIIAQVAESTFRRCRGERSVFVAVDATSLTFTDEKQVRELGAVGTWSSSTRGAHAMTALAVGATDIIGVCAQQIWIRKAPSKARPWGACIDPQKTETRFWLDVLRDARAGFLAHAPDCTPWFQLDRGADCWAVLEAAHEEGLKLTVRAAHNRKIENETRLLRQIVAASPVVAVRRVPLPARTEPTCRRKRLPNRKRVHAYFPPRKARLASLAIRATTLPLVLSTPHGQVTVEFGVVHVREKGRRQNDSVDWLLLTTHKIRGKKDALRVVDGYVRRWTIEELHRTWKRGLCRVEDSQLRSFNAIQKWATILLAVAARALHLSRRSRVEPDIPADTEFSRYELDALIALRQPKGIRLGHTPSLGEAVRWLADLGGAMGGKARYGPRVIGRGLLDVLAAALAFEKRDKMR